VFSIVFMLSDLKVISTAGVNTPSVDVSKNYLFWPAMINIKIQAENLWLKKIIHIYVVLN